MIDTLSLHQVLWVAIDGQLLPVRIDSLEGNRVRGVDLEGEERWLGSKRIYWVSRGFVPDQAQLAATLQAAQSAAADLDLAAAWKALEPTEQGEEVGPDRLLQLLACGNAASDHDALALAVFGSALHFKIKGQCLVASTRVQVAAIEAKALEEALAQAAFSGAIAWLQAKLAGEPAEPMTETLAEHLDALKSVALFGRDASLSRVGCDLLKMLVPDESGDVAIVAFDILCRLGIYRPDENLAPHRAGLRRTFPPIVLAEAEEMAACAASYPGRRDMTGLLTLSIDDVETSEIDDAFALVGDRLHVFIADVAHFVPLGGALDGEASERVSTTYLPEGKIPMLPGRIGQDLASLNQGEVRPALCFSATIDGRGGFTDFELSEVLCKVDHRLDYASIDFWLAMGGGDPALMPTLRTLEQWSEAHLDRRLEAGAMVFQRGEVHPKLDAEGRVTLYRPDANGPSRTLIAEMMVTICFKSAQLLRDQNLPTIFRGQSAPDNPIDASQLDLSDPSVEYQLLRTIKPSRLSLHPKRHAALGAECYAQVSSPIRRYSDLMLQRQLKSHLRGEASVYTLEEVGGALHDVEAKQGVIKRLERESSRYWLLRYLEQHPGTEMEGVALRRLKRRWLINLPFLAMGSTMLARGRLYPGKRFNVRVTEVNARRDVLVLEEV